MSATQFEKHLVENGFSVDDVGRLAHAVSMAYRKHHLGDDSIGWDELSSVMCDALCEAMGDRWFQGFVAKHSEADDHPDDKPWRG